mgnify:CR=1 FL=1
MNDTSHSLSLLSMPMDFLTSISSLGIPHVKTEKQEDKDGLFPSLLESSAPDLLTGSPTGCTSVNEVSPELLDSTVPLKAVPSNVETPKRVPNSTLLLARGRVERAQKDIILTSAQAAERNGSPTTLLLIEGDRFEAAFPVATLHVPAVTKVLLMDAVGLGRWHDHLEQAEQEGGDPANETSGAERRIAFYHSERGRGAFVCSLPLCALLQWLPRGAMTLSKWTSALNAAVFSRSQRCGLMALVEAALRADSLAAPTWLDFYMVDCVVVHAGALQHASRGREPSLLLHPAGCVEARLSPPDEILLGSGTTSNCVHAAVLTWCDETAADVATAFIPAEATAEAEHSACYKFTQACSAAANHNAAAISQLRGKVGPLVMDPRFEKLQRAIFLSSSSLPDDDLADADVVTVDASAVLQMMPLLRDSVVRSPLLSVFTDQSPAWASSDDRDGAVRAIESALDPLLGMQIEVVPSERLRRVLPVVATSLLAAIC